MPKFVLIDPSLQGVGGHHFAYAHYLLRAAETAGFEPWLATHRKFHDQAELPESWRVLPSYQRGTYSKRRFVVASDRREGARTPGWLVRLMSNWWNDRRRSRRSGLFARDTSALLSQIELSPGDQVFLPTVSDLELLGLARFLASDDRSAAVDWHLQFHFPICSGYEPDYAAQDANLEKLRRAFRQAATLAGDHRLHFYATTDALADQYSRLGVAQFESLPYPANPALQTGRSRSSARTAPLRISYLGDARHEKGFELLPRIVEAMKSEYIDAGRARFVIQSDCHFSLPAQGHNIAVVESKAELERMKGPYVELIDEPLEPVEFARQTLQCDIGLLPYNPTNYNVRCSGIFVDLLSVGAPCVVPAATWMADQLAESAREYHVGLRHDSRVCGRTIVRSGSRTAVPKGATDLVLFLRWPVDLKLCSGAYARVESSCWGAGRVSLGRWPNVVGPGRPDRMSTAFVRLPMDAESIMLEWRNAHGSQAVDFREVEACFLTSNPGQSTPCGAAGLTAADPDQYAALLGEIIEHYPHYRQTATSLARRWSEAHSPARVLAELLSQRPSIPLSGNSVVPRPGPTRRAIRP